MYKAFLYLRAIIFYSISWPLTIWYGLTAWLLAPTPHKVRTGYLVIWNIIVIHLAKWICGIKFEVTGKEHIQQTPFVALAKHQSQWETYFLQWLLYPTAVVLKKELLSVPFFGWALKQYDPIAIDRSNPRQALKAVQEQGAQRINKGMSVLIFPEGTRTPPGQKQKYARSGANIGIDSEAPIIPIAHNAGIYWPENTWIKYPGTIQVTIGEPIDPKGKSSKQLTDEVEQWIEGQVAAMPQSPS